MTARIFHIWVIPNERVSEFMWEGMDGTMPVQISPVPLNLNESMLPYNLIAEAWCPQSIKDAFSTCLDRNIVLADIHPGEE